MKNRTIAILFIMFWLIQFIGGGIILLITRKDENDNYIQNIETKLNIYEQSYDNFVLEDSLRQVE